MKSYIPKNIWRVGGEGQAMAEGNKTTELNLEMPCDLETPHTLEPILPAASEKNVFHFFRPSASGKPQLLKRVKL